MRILWSTIPSLYMYKLTNIYNSTNSVFVILVSCWETITVGNGDQTKETEKEFGNL